MVFTCSLKLQNRKKAGDKAKDCLIKMSIFRVKFYQYSLLILSSVFFLSACSSDGGHKMKLFTLLDSSQTHVDFENTLTFRENFNLFTYMNYHDGGGIALVDVNNDGLADIFFTSNMEDNK